MLVLNCMEWVIDICLNFDYLGFLTDREGEDIKICIYTLSNIYNRRL